MSDSSFACRRDSVVMSIVSVACASFVVGTLGCAGQAPEPREPAPAATEQTQPAPVAEAPPAAPEVPAPAEPPAPVRIVLKDVGFATPESVLYDSESDTYLVSNIQGTPFDKDDNGFISKVSPEGQVVELKWIDGAQDAVKLNAPKGMSISNGVLYVADIDTVRKFDAKTGEPKGEIAIKGSTFLNDVSISTDGTVYVTDSGLKMGASGFESSGTDAVYKLVKDKPKALIKSKELKGPNGILVDDTGVWVVTFSSNELANVASGKREGVRALPKGSLDGLVKTSSGKWLTSSWETGEVFAGSPTEEFVVQVTDVKSPADIGYDSKRNRVLVPLFTENAVVIQALE